RQVENADDQREQAGDVEEDDAPCETRKADANEQVPAVVQQLGQPPAPLGGRRTLIEPFRLDLNLEAFRRSIEHGATRSQSSGVSNQSDRFLERPQLFLIT